MARERRKNYQFYLLHPSAGVVAPLRVRAASPDAAALKYARNRFGRQAVAYRCTGYSAGFTGSYFFVAIRAKNGDYLPAGAPGCTDADLDTLQAYLEGGLQVWTLQGITLLTHGQFPQRSGPFNVDQLIERHLGNPQWLRAPKGDHWIFPIWREIRKTFQLVRY